MRTKLATVVCIVGFALCGAPTSVSAHHAFAADADAKKAVSFKGTVTKMEWINPHTWLHVDVKKHDGTVENWAIEAGTPNVLFRRGFTKESLLPGTEVVIEGYQAKDGTHRANGRNLTLPNGKMLFLGSSWTRPSFQLAPFQKKKKKGRTHSPRTGL